MSMPNKYPGQCQKCQVSVAPNAGVVEKIGGKWTTFCSEHNPAGAGVVQPVETRRQLTAEGIVNMPYEPNNLPLLRSMPGAKWHGVNKYWYVSIKQADLPRVLEIADKLQLAVAPELRNSCVKTEQALKATDARLYPYQVNGVDHLSRRDHALLGDDMGLGKTVQVLASLPESRPVLVVCPNSLKHNWVAEARKWTPKYTTHICEGRDSFRFPKNGEIVTVNYDILPAWLNKSAEEAALKNAKASKEDAGQRENDIRAAEEAIKVNTALRATRPEGLIVVVDECQYAKKNSAARSLKIRGLCELASKVWALTGTPLDNRPLDLWGVLTNTGMAKEVFGSWMTFTKLFNGHKGRFGWEFGLPNIEVPERLRRVMLRRLKSEVLPDLPKKTYTTLEVNGLSASLVRRLDELQVELMNEGWDSDELPPFEKFSEIRALLAESRIEAMIETVERYEESGKPLVVFSAHRSPIDALKNREGWMVITGDTSPANRQAAVEAFQSGKLKGIGLTIDAGGTGLTLTHGDTILAVDQHWVPSHNEQMEARICRIGQTSDKCHIIRMVSTHVLDRHVHDLLCQKIEVIFKAVDAKVEVEIPVAAPVATSSAKSEQNGTEAVKTTPEASVSAELKALALQAVRIIAGMCDGAREQDERGFNKIDSYFGKELANKNVLSDKQAVCAIRLARKYRRQLPSDLVVALNVGEMK